MMYISIVLAAPFTIIRHADIALNLNRIKPDIEKKNGVRMKIEKMEISDYEEVYDMWFKTPGMGLNTIDDSEDGIRKFLDRNPSTCFIARENNRIAGVILSGHDGRRGYIHHTAVAEDSRFRGIGRALVEKAVEALREEGIHKVSFVVFKKNEDGNNFWKKLGFQERNDLVYRDKLISDQELIRIDT